MVADPRDAGSRLVTSFWTDEELVEAPPDIAELAERARARAFWEPTIEELFDAQQARNARAARHRYALRNEQPAERARRQQARAEQMAYELGSTRPNVVKAMLALVQADEVINPKGDPPPPAAPGARAVQKPKKAPAKTSRTARVATDREARGPGDTGRSTPLRSATPEKPPAQMGFWE